MPIVDTRMFWVERCVVNRWLEFWSIPVVLPCNCSGKDAQFLFCLSRYRPTYAFFLLRLLQVQIAAPVGAYEYAHSVILGR